MVYYPESDAKQILKNGYFDTHPRVCAPLSMHLYLYTRQGIIPLGGSFVQEATDIKDTNTFYVSHPDFQARSAHFAANSSCFGRAGRLFCRPTTSLR